MEFLRTLPHRLLDEYHAPFAITIKCSLPQEPAVPPRTGKEHAFKSAASLGAGLQAEGYRTSHSVT